MNGSSIAPCGVICDICLGFQRSKNTCVGCNVVGSKAYHCEACSIKSCPEKQGNPLLLCGDCEKFPCRRIKNLDKRYRTKYGESNIENLRAIAEQGMDVFIAQQEEKWKCPQCGKLLCVHRAVCLNCSAKNDHFPAGTR
ncbi:MAG: DUF3795 domain-containing protein [Kiritimatiellia bacterium]